MEKSENINDLAAALAKAQATIKGACKDKNNPFYKSKYADLSNIWDACREALTNNQLSVVQAPEQSEGGGIAVETMLMHSSGQFIASRYVMPITDSKINAQTIGSAITYARRYALAAMVGVAPEDDDGNAAVGDGKNHSHTEEKPKNQLTWCSPERFKENESGWKKLIEEGMPAGDLLSSLENKTRLTEPQIKQIKSWALEDVPQ